VCNPTSEDAHLIQGLVIGQDSTTNGQAKILRADGGFQPAADDLVSLLFQLGEKCRKKN